MDSPAIRVDAAAPGRARAWVAAHALALIALSSALVAVLARAPFLGWPITVDEAGYAYGARWWFDGLTLYSDDLWFDRPQGVFIAYQLGMTLFGDSVEAVRLSGALWAAATAAGVTLIAARVFDRRVALVAGPLVAVASAAPAIEGFTANAEVFMIAAVTASAYCAWGRQWFLAGLLAGLAILLKPSGLAAALLAAFWLFQLRESPRAWALLIAGGSLPILASVAHGIATAGFDDYFFAVVWFRTTVGGDSHPLLALIAGWYWTAPVWLLLGALSYPGWRRLSSWPRARSFMLAWLLTSLVGMAMGGNWFLHYFQQLVPPLGVLAAVGVVTITADQRIPGGRVALSATVAAVVFAALVAPMALKDPQDGLAAMFDSDGYRQVDEIGGYVASITEPDDLVYVTLSHASILYRTDRRSSSPYLYAQQPSEIPGALEEAAAHLEDGVPAAVVVVHRQLDLLDERDLIRSALPLRYELARSFDDGAIEVWTAFGG